VCVLACVCVYDSVSVCVRSIALKSAQISVPICPHADVGEMQGTTM
jgi:hypothetical protein